MAGIAYAEELLKNNKSFVVFSDCSQQSSEVAGGLYNPVILKRFTKVWKAKEQLEHVACFYPELEQKLDVTVNFKVPVYRRFVSYEEQNLWFDATDKPLLQPFLSTKLVKNTNNAIHAPFGFGEVLLTGRIDTEVLVKSYSDYLDKNGWLIKEKFNYEELVVNDNHVQYKEYNAGNIVFCDGFGLKTNPYFNYLPLNGTKGQLLTIHSPELRLDFVLKSSVFLIPLGKDRYRVGATYEWDDKTNKVTKEAREELLEKMESFVKCDYEVIGQQAGIRPTVTDRRPLVGEHPRQKRVHVLNGLGSRGVMIAPFAAKQLFDHIEHAISIDEDMDIKRFENKYFASSGTVF